MRQLRTDLPEFSVVVNFMRVVCAVVGYQGKDSHRFLSIPAVLMSF